MFVDARGLSENTVIESAVCVIGAGAAGITLAMALRTAGFPVAVLESGGLEFDEATQDLDAGELAGVPNYPTDKSRLRFFGGTTNHWDGTCRPLDEIDFRPRPAVPLSGWPLRGADLLPYYEQAQRICDLGPFNYDLDFWVGRTDLRAPAFDPTRLRATIFQISPPTRFGEAYRPDLERSASVTIYLNANAIDLQANQTASAVQTVKAACLGGPSFLVRARYVVLATGGLENARILLLSRGVQAAGLGNGHDLVGRYFMDHPYFPWSAVARFATPTPPMPYAPPLTDMPVFATLTGGAEEERRALSGGDGTAGFQILLSPLHRLIEGVDSLKTVAHALTHFSRPPELWDHIGAILRDRDAVADTLYRNATGQKSSPFTVAAGPSDQILGASMDILLEQTPNRDSRVALSRGRDALDQNRLVLDWRLGEAERRTYRRAQELAAGEFGRLGLGRVKAKPLPDDSWPSDILGANHHMGTTRMSDDPKTGVVDGNGRVHGLSNLYVAGSSVFPTAGYANPTLTIVALSLRLADELRRVIG